MRSNFCCCEMEKWLNFKLLSIVLMVALADCRTLLSSQRNSRTVNALKAAESAQGSSATAGGKNAAAAEAANEWTVLDLKELQQMDDAGLTLKSVNVKAPGEDGGVEQYLGIDGFKNLFNNFKDKMMATFGKFSGDGAPAKMAQSLRQVDTVEVREGSGAPAQQANAANMGHKVAHAKKAEIAVE